MGTRQLSRNDFLRLIGLDIDQPRDAQIFHMMRVEARQGLMRLQATQSQSANPARVNGTMASGDASGYYAAAGGGGGAPHVEQFSEAAVRQETLRIAAHASPATAAIYSSGSNPGTSDEGSWIVRYMLWHESEGVNAG